jgi:hypothetical protein
VLYDDGRWYHGGISAYDPRKGEFTVMFDDGDEQVVKLPDQDVRLNMPVSDLCDAILICRK